MAADKDIIYFDKCGEITQFLFLKTRYYLSTIGESPSGKAGAFEAPIPWFESMLPSHLIL